MQKETILPAAAVVFAVFALALSPAPNQTPRPNNSYTIPAVWGDLGARLVDLGVIDAEKMRSLYGEKWNGEYERLLTGTENGALVMTQENSGYLLNLLWALGLANKNPILEDKTEMMNPDYGGPEGFASTGGWTLAQDTPTGSGQGGAMEHYDKHELITLTPQQQTLVDKVSRSVHRPCCGNSAHFPDCNHGMAMLALLQLMASQGVPEGELLNTAHAVNSFWFPESQAGSCSA